MNRFLKWSTWKMIIQSRTTDYKNSKTDWCKERRKICGECQYNSKNKYNLSFKERLFMFLQITNAICTACTCSVKFKTKCKNCKCGRTELGMESFWKE